MTSKQKFLLYAGLALATLLLLTLGLQTERRVQRWKEDVAGLRAENRAAEARITRLTHENQVLQLEVQRLDTRIIRRDTVIRTVRERVAADPVPDSCATVVARRDTLIVEQQDQIVDLGDQLALERQRLANLTESNDLRGAVKDHALDVIEKAPVGTPFWRHLVPELRATVGPAYDLLAQKFRPAVVTAGLSWKIPLP